MTVKLRKIKLTDFKYFLHWWQDKDLIQLTSGIFEEKEKLKEYFKEMINSDADHYFMIIFNDNPIGNIAIYRITNKKFGINIVIGEKEYWGKGLGTSAINKAVDYAFHKYKFNQGELEVRPDNKRAIKAYLKCGWKKAGYKYYKNKYQPKVLKMVITK